MSDADDAAPDDRRLLTELAEALGPDAVPSGLLDACDALVTWADVDHELAELLEAGAAEPAGARGGTPAGPATQLVFELGGGAAAVEVDIAGGRLEGRVFPADHVHAVLERPRAAPATTEVDDGGRFRFDELPTGPARLRLVGGGAELATDWFLV